MFLGAKVAPVMEAKQTVELANAELGVLARMLAGKIRLLTTVCILVSYLTKVMEHDLIAIVGSMLFRLLSVLTDNCLVTNPLKWLKYWRYQWRWLSG